MRGRGPVLLHVGLEAGVPDPVEEDVGVVDRVNVRVTASTRPVTRSG